MLFVSRMLLFHLFRWGSAHEVRIAIRVMHTAPSAQITIKDYQYRSLAYMARIVLCASISYVKQSCLLHLQLDYKNRTVSPLSFICNCTDVKDIPFEISFPRSLPGSNQAFYPLQVSYPLQCKVTPILSITVCLAAKVASVIHSSSGPWS